MFPYHDICLHIPKHQDKFELFRALGLKKTYDIAEQKIRKILNKEINKLEIKTMIKPLSESDDINRYINGSNKRNEKI